MKVVYMCRPEFKNGGIESGPSLKMGGFQKGLSLKIEGVLVYESGIYVPPRV